MVNYFALVGCRRNNNENIFFSRKISSKFNRSNIIQNMKIVNLKRKQQYFGRKIQFSK